MNHTAVVVARRADHCRMGGWNPWRALRARADVEMRFVDIPKGRGDAFHAHQDGAHAILLRRSMGRRERNVALAHELVHLERGGGADAAGMPATWSYEVATEEHRVHCEVARRLVPLKELDEWRRRREDSDIPTSVLDVAEEFDTTEQLAELAMLLLQGGTS